jgi:signal-transduction protein with cAMP-binding, CBS, and nucleotidyltransferase domain
MVRRLSLITVRDIPLAQLNGATAPTETVDAGATLRDALDAVLRAEDGRVRVTDAGATLGIVDADVIRRASR